MTAQIISFTAYRNSQRAQAEIAAREATQKENEKQRIIKSAEDALMVASLLDKAPEDALTFAVCQASKEAETIEQEKQEKATRYMPAYCDPNNEFRGARYDATRNLSLKEVAKRIRQDIKQMIKAGTIPSGTKVSIRMDGYNALRVSITALPADLKVYNPEYVQATKNFNQPPEWDLRCDRYTKKMQAIIDALDENTRSYNRDNSDSMVDYFDVRFYDGRADIGWELNKQIQERETVELDQ